MKKLIMDKINKFDMYSCVCAWQIQQTKHFQNDGTELFSHSQSYQNIAMNYCAL